MSDLNNISQADDTRERSQELLPYANSVLSAKGMFTVEKKRFILKFNEI